MNELLPVFGILGFLILLLLLSGKENFIIEGIKGVFKK